MHVLTLHFPTKLPDTTQVLHLGVTCTRSRCSKYVDVSFAACLDAFEKHAKRGYTVGVLLSFRDGSVL
jgi:hypothetical protein